MSTKSLPLFLLLFLVIACGDAPTAPPPSTEAPPPELPPEFAAVLNAHGGLEAFRAQRTLHFAFPRGEDTERQTVDLHDRRERIERADMSQGYDGTDTWLAADTSYTGDPLFYRNLMFYFYAMPWVLADPGINYEIAEPLTVGGTTYPGLKISYGDSIGLSPNDNYYLHYDAASKQMRWLGYTVTYRSGSPSDQLSWIEYPSWSTYEGIALPDTLIWYTVEDNLPTEPRSVRPFTDVSVRAEAMEDGFFAGAAGAEVIAPKEGE